MVLNLDIFDKWRYLLFGVILKKKAFKKWKTINNQLRRTTALLLELKRIKEESPRRPGRLARISTLINYELGNWKASRTLHAIYQQNFWDLYRQCRAQAGSI